MKFDISAAGLSEQSEMIFLPPDLYMSVPDEGWFVLSPWNQGVRPDEVPDFNLEEPLLDYPGLISSLSDVERLPDEEVDGKTHEVFTGSTDVDELPWLAGPEARGDADVSVWLDADSSLPGKVELVSDLGGGARIQATFEFLDYGLALTLPDRPAEARPWRDLVFPDATCTGDAYEGCLAAQTGIQPTANATCEGSGRRVCLVPLGQVSPELVQHLVDHYRSQYALEVSVLTPLEVPAEMAEPLREQIDAVALIDYMGGHFPEAFDDPEAVLIGLTPLDLYDSTSHFRYLFGLKGDFSDPKAVVSTMRMTPVFYGEAADQELFLSRMRKLVSKYVGLLYYGLPPSDDPQSPMFDSILGPDDLDTMTEPLPVR
jgi:predicted Zn-dependent protease